MTRIIILIILLSGMIRGGAQQQKATHKLAAEACGKYFLNTWYLYMPAPKTCDDSLVAIRHFKGYLGFVGSIQFINSQLLVFKKHYRCATGVDVEKEQAPQSWILTDDRVIYFGRYAIKIESLFNDTMIMRATKPNAAK